MSTTTTVTATRAIYHDGKRFDAGDEFVWKGTAEQLKSAIEDDIVTCDEAGDDGAKASPTLGKLRAEVKTLKAREADLEAELDDERKKANQLQAEIGDFTKTMSDILEALDVPVGEKAKPVELILALKAKVPAETPAEPAKTDKDK